jgi:hypothetical protein
MNKILSFVEFWAEALAIEAWLWITEPFILLNYHIRATWAWIRWRGQRGPASYPRNWW